MAQVTVEQLAKVVGASTERLLTQMKEAGLPHSAASLVFCDLSCSVMRASYFIRVFLKRISKIQLLYLILNRQLIPSKIDFLKKI